MSQEEQGDEFDHSAKENADLFVGTSNAFRSTSVEAFTARSEVQINCGRNLRPFQEITNSHSSIEGKTNCKSLEYKRRCTQTKKMDPLSSHVISNAARSTMWGSSQMGTEIDRGPALAANTIRRNSLPPGTSDDTASPGQPKVLHRAVDVSLQAKNKIGPSTESLLKGKDQVPAAKPESYAKVAAGNPRPLRPLDNRQRSMEGWRAARERRNRTVIAAVRSQECLDKNHARFDRLHEETYHQKQYPELWRNVPLTVEKTAEIRDTFQFLRKTQPQPTGLVVHTVIDTQQLANRLDFLRRKTFVLYTVDVTPTRDAVAEWAETILHQELGIKVTRIRVFEALATEEEIPPAQGDLLHTESGAAAHDPQKRKEADDLLAEIQQLKTDAEKRADKGLAVPADEGVPMDTQES
ncbi:hypothetical protein R1sor_026939 [Riccia sorocarpa]|uniref:Uncharacterized protein n=1 Tax=Riccia sorocarpa TaxID=122646 RepID=A0ABD3GGI3_9MARC